MTCIGHSNSCPSHVGLGSPEPAVTFTDNVLNTDIEVKAQHFNEMLYYTEIEKQRWMSWGFGSTIPGWVGYPAGVQNTNNIIYAADYHRIRDQLISLAGSYGTDGYITGALIYDNEAGGTKEIRDRINALRAVCLCDCNYTCTCDCNYCVCNCNYACTCNCNYCVCNCNYCVCNCNYCVCDCNYACVCNCDYACTCDCNQGNNGGLE